jgi:hypothetical protein
MTSMLIRLLMNMTRQIKASVLRLWRVEKCPVLARTIVEAREATY